MTLETPAGLYHAAGCVPRTLSIARAVRVQSAGNHHPLLCEMEDASGPAGNWVVKPVLVLSRATDRGTFGVLAELAGSEVCAWAGLRTPSIGLTRFPDPLDEPAIRSGLGALGPAEREEILEIFRVNRGRLGFCCRFLKEAVDLRPAHLKHRRWQSTSLPDAVALLLVDAYLRHDDRRIENPNAVWHAGRLVAIDHGSAFAGLTRPGSTGDDLARQTRLHSKSFAVHVALAAASSAEEALWESAVARLEGVAPAVVTALAQSWPAELDHDEQNGQRGLRSRLARFLVERGRHVRELREGLRELCEKKS